MATNTDKTYFGKKNNKLERDEALQAKKRRRQRLHDQTVAVETIEKEIEDLEEISR